jgi:UDP-glucose 4-epimerase
LAEIYSDVDLAKEELSWQAEHSLERMCEDIWRYVTLQKV